MKKSLLLLTAIIACLTMTACGLGPLMQTIDMALPDKGEIVLDHIPLTENIEGKQVDFTGIQVYLRKKGYNNTSIYKYRGKSPFISNRLNLFHDWPKDGVWNINLRFIENFDEKKRDRLTFLFDERDSCLLFFPSSCVFWDRSRYGTVLHRQEFVRDELSCVNSLPFRTPYREGKQGKMAGNRLSDITGNSPADYFLVFAIRLLEIWPPDDEHAYTVLNIALITAMYDREGKKVYSAIYTESIEERYKDDMYYNCIMQLFEHHGKQINNDLSFLNTAAKAEYPTLEDLRIKAYNSTTKDTKDLYIPRERKW